MNGQDLMNWFNDIESRYPVNKWKANDVHLWPLIRIRMGYWLRKKNTPPQAPPQKITTMKENPVRRAYRNAVALFQFLIYYLSISEKKYLFVGAFSHREKVDKMYINKFFDPIIDQICNADREVAVWEYDVFFQDKIYNHDKYIFPIEKLKLALPYLQLWIKLSNSRKTPSILPSYQSFIRELEETPLLKQYKNELKKIFFHADKIKLFSELYEILLKKINSKSVLILCYYSLDTFPIIFACKKLGIPCADFQHGPQGNVHFAYGRWNNIPGGGYNLLPNYFLTWNKAAANTIDRGFGNSPFHKGIYFGHPWINYWKAQKQKTGKEHAKKKVLFSLQPIGELLSEDEISMIKNTQDQYLWLMRLHPRQLYQQQALEELIKENNLRVEIEEATFKPLPLVLAQTDVHCTRSSGTTIEAAVFGVPTLLLSPSGVAYYPEEIANGYAYQPNTYDSIGFIRGLKEIEENYKEDSRQKAISHDSYQETLDLIL